jgi:hypothetical protein
MQGLVEFALGVLLSVIMLRIAWEILQPLLPILAIGVWVFFLVGVGWRWWQKRRGWW